MYYVHAPWQTPGPGTGAVPNVIPEQLRGGKGVLTTVL